MDLIDRINKTAFIGKEFLTWLWWQSDLRDGQFEDVSGFGGETIEVWFDHALTLDTAMEKVRETNAIRSEAPAEAREAYAALQAGKKAAQAKLRIIRGEREWQCSLRADNLAIAGVKVPGLFSKEEHEHIIDRLALLQELEDVIDALYKQFLAVRLSDQAWAFERAKIAEWIWECR